jgi:hypothetical protein
MPPTGPARACAACAGSGGAGAGGDVAVARVVFLAQISANVRPGSSADRRGLWPILVGGVIAMLMGPWRLRFSKLPRVLLSLADRARSLTVASAAGAEEVDGALRQWPSASLAVSALVLIFGMAMLAAH